MILKAAVATNRWTDIGNKQYRKINTKCRSRKPQIPLVESRHDTTHDLANHAFWHRKKSRRAVTLVGQHGATRSSRQAPHVLRGVATAWTGVDVTFFRSCFWEWCKSRGQTTKLLHASTTASSSSAMLKQARRDMHDKRDTLVQPSSSTCLSTWREKMQQIFGQNAYEMEYELT